jgi:ABC-type multidrug transport system fused ATPase/permease subunit
LKWVILLVILNSLLDFFSIAAFLPLLFLVVKPESISGQSLIHTLYSQIGFSSPGQFVVAFAIVLLLIAIVKNIIARWIATRKTSYAFGISEDLASRGLTRYLKMEYLNFAQSDFTRELNRIVNYPLAFANNVVLPLTMLISELFVSAFILAGIAIYDWRVVLMLALLCIPILLLYQVRRTKLKGISKNLKEKYPLMMKYALQVIEAFTEIKSMQRENFFHKRFQAVSKEMSKVFAKDQVIQSGTVRLTEIVVAVLICAVIIYSVSFQQNYQQTLMLLGVYSGAAFRVIPSVNRILHSTQQIRLHEHLFEELLPSQEYDRNEFTAATESLEFNDTLELRNISFGYSNEDKTLKNISLYIRKGEKVALTGISGGGKTTLLLIILRFVKETDGEIYIDGNRILNDEAWRRLIGYVPQNPYIVDGSLVDNIAFGIPAEQIDRSKLKRIVGELGLEGLVMKYSTGLDTVVGERGLKLSGGQRQRIALGRALYADADILLLDEVTNQVHSLMEEEILNILERLSRQNKTIVMVTHKISRPDFFDVILNLENGSLREVPKQSRI